MHCRVEEFMRERGLRRGDHAHPVLLSMDLGTTWKQDSERAGTERKGERAFFAPQKIVVVSARSHVVAIAKTSIVFSFKSKQRNPRLFVGMRPVQGADIARVHVSRRFVNRVANTDTHLSPKPKGLIR